MSIFSAAGCFGRPGIVRMLPVSATMKPAPALMRSSLTVMRKPVGRPIVRQRILRLGHADRHLVEAELLNLLELLLGCRREVYAVAAVDLFRDLLDLLRDALVDIVDEVEVIRLLRRLDNLVGELESAFAALGPDFRQPSS